MKLAVITHLASPYQVELFNSIARRSGVSLQVIYINKTSSGRLWGGVFADHEAIYLDSVPVPIERAESAVIDADLVVFNYYANRHARHLLKIRARTGKAWSFWGERPGFRKPEWLGRIRRRIELARLHDSSAPIWGIGAFAVDQYRQEFGAGHSYLNLPYYSDLDRFQLRDHRRKCASEFAWILYSGSLIHRKGVDLLAQAFLQIAQEFSRIGLRLLGEGELRPMLEKILEPVKQRVEFVGFKDWSDLPAVYAEADVLCVPSRYDGWGLVVPEGLSAGLPVIATDKMGAALAFLQSGYNGWLVPANDGEALLVAMRQAALLAPESLELMSMNARRSICEHNLQEGTSRFISASAQAIKEWRP